MTMTYDIDKVRTDIQSYRRRFSEKWQDVYGYPFQHEVLRAKRWASSGKSHAAQDFLEKYQNRIRHIKNIIDNE